MNNKILITGSSGLYPKYDASELAEMGKMVVVCISYRLGCFGFLYDAGFSRAKRTSRSTL